MSNSVAPGMKARRKSPEEHNVVRRTRDAKRAAREERSKHERDGLIMDTNKSSIVSKRSVEKFYYDGQPEFFRHFVSKIKRRSPLINRGYWLRMRAIEYSVQQFLAQRTDERKLVVNLGCGYDPLPFWILGKQAEVCSNTTFIDVDYPALMQNKLQVVEKTEQIRALIPDFALTSNKTGLLGASDAYAIVACDLIDTSPLQDVLRKHFAAGNPDVAILFVSEVSTAYMPKEGSQAVFEWTASYPNAQFVLLEQQIPDGVDHPFAQTMMGHFEKLRTPLRAVGTMEQMRQRFIAAGYLDSGISIRSLWELWSDLDFLTDEQRRALDAVEPFDEWEEFALYGSHYFLLVADTHASKVVGHHSQSGTSTLHSKHMDNSGIATAIPSQSAPHELSGPQEGLWTHELLEPHDFRRFAALIPSKVDDEISTGPYPMLGLHGGMGTRERMADCVTYTCEDKASQLSVPPLRSGIMCHTVTAIGKTRMCMLAGGRTSPDKASAECWLRVGNDWLRKSSLPSGRYRHAAVSLTNDLEPSSTEILLFGGKTSDGTVLKEWLLWDGDVWRPIEVVGKSPSARFGSAIINDGADSRSGILVGGMSSAGRVINELWHWKLSSDFKLYCENVTEKAMLVLKGDPSILGRYGAQLIRSHEGILLVGGVTGGRMLTRHDEILNMTTLRPLSLHGPRPLLIGCSVQAIDGGILVLGGGATCFSFGTTWNRSCIISHEKPGSFDMKWHPVVATNDSKEGVVPSPPLSKNHGNSSKKGARKMEPVDILVIDEGFNFSQVLEARHPVVIKKCSLGPCLAKWNTQYLKDAVGVDRMVSIHVATSKTMDFRSKNFEYQTQQFGAFLDGVDRGEQLYLRSLSRNAPSIRPTTLAEDFPQIEPDFVLPQELALVMQNAHSSPLRISGPVQMWLHYDVMANILCQVRGVKHVRLFSPSDVSYLGFEPGASSSSVDVFDDTTIASDEMMSHTRPFETELHPGDILYIPPMWMHATAPLEDPSISVNVFFRDMPNGYAAGRDVYGNRDLAAYEKGRKDMSKIIHSFDDLPDDVSGFYLQRLASEMSERARALSDGFVHR